MLHALHAASERVRELRGEIASVPREQFPPQRLLDFPSRATEEKVIDMVDAADVEIGPDAKASDRVDKTVPDAPTLMTAQAGAVTEGKPGFEPLIARFIRQANHDTPIGRRSRSFAGEPP